MIASLFSMCYALGVEGPPPPRGAPPRRGGGRDRTRSGGMDRHEIHLNEGHFGHLCALTGLALAVSLAVLAALI